jgi:hypothetical protein
MRTLVASSQRAILTVLLSTLCAAAAQAQDAKIQIERLDKLAPKAEHVVEVTLDERMLQLAAKFLSQNNPTEAKVREIVGGLKGVYVRVFEFARPGEYAAGDLESIRSQLRAPGWQKIVGVTSKRGGDNVDVHLQLQGENIAGLTIVAADPKQLTVVNIVGPIDLDKLSQLEGLFGIPKLDLDKSKAKPRNE